MFARVSVTVPPGDWPRPRPRLRPRSRPRSRPRPRPRSRLRRRSRSRPRRRLRLRFDARRVYNDDYLRRDDGHGGGGGGGGGSDGTGTGNTSHYDHDVEYVGDMYGCATSTRRGLGTATGKSARRTKSSCFLHSKPGIR